MSTPRNRRGLAQARRGVRARILRRRHEYPLGLADVGEFPSRVSFWNYAALLRSTRSESFGLECVSEVYPGRDPSHGRQPVVSVGTAQNYEIEALEALFPKVLHIALSPFLAWAMATRYERWDQTAYLPPNMARDFVPPGHNWVFLKTLEMVEDPGEWLAAASENSEHWIYIVTDRSLRRRIGDIDPEWIVRELSGDWEPRALLWEEQTWINPQSVIWRAALARDKAGLLLMRRDEPVSTASSAT